jgi:excisionase family DNA binding protein
MPERFEDDPNDPWLTLAEIAEELRLSPATLRSWISKGTLRAMRAGQRKWLVRRSELERMLRGDDLGDETPEPSAPATREFDTISPPALSPHWSEEAREHVSPKRWLGVAESEWQAALRASEMAPPDAWFAFRIRQLADAAARKAAALALVDAETDVELGPQPAARGMALSYELRPGGNRPGPTKLWQRFDRAVDKVADALAGTDVAALQRAMNNLSIVMHDLADVLERSANTQPLRPRRDGDALGRRTETAPSATERSVS